MHTVIGSGKQWRKNKGLHLGLRFCLRIVWSYTDIFPKRKDLFSNLSSVNYRTRNIIYTQINTARNTECDQTHQILIWEYIVHNSTVLDCRFDTACPRALENRWRRRAGTFALAFFPSTIKVNMLLRQRQKFGTVIQHNHSSLHRSFCFIASHRRRLLQPRKAWLTFYYFCPPCWKPGHKAGYRTPRVHADFTRLSRYVTRYMATVVFAVMNLFLLWPICYCRGDFWIVVIGFVFTVVVWFLQ